MNLLPSLLPPSMFLGAANLLHSNNAAANQTLANTHIILHQVWMVSFNAVVQDGDHNIFSSVTSLPSTYYIHI